MSGINRSNALRRNSAAARDADSGAFVLEVARWKARISIGAINRNSAACTKPYSGTSKRSCSMPARCQPQFPKSVTKLKTRSVIATAHMPTRRTAIGTAIRTRIAQREGSSETARLSNAAIGPHRLENPGRPRRVATQDPAGVPRLQSARTAHGDGRRTILHDVSCLAGAYRGRAARLVTGRPLFSAHQESGFVFGFCAQPPAGY